jgi:transposase
LVRSVLLALRPPRLPAPPPIRLDDAAWRVTVTISAELQAKILRFYHVEKWRTGTIARQLGVHHNTVAAVLGRAGLAAHAPMPRAMMIDPYLPFILQTLDAYPTLTAARLYAMVYERGYRGQPDHFRHVIARHRPRRKAEAYLRLRTLPGEQAQCDWGHFGHMQIGRARRPLMAFVMVLSFSRRIFLRFFLDARMDAFLAGHVEAFQAWAGVPRVVLYDNLKSAVLERRGDTIQFNPTLIALAAHYRFQPRPVAVARGNEKGRVERAIRYIRDNFFAARRFKDLDDLNAQADAWCGGPAADRPCPGETMTVREAYAHEAPSLAPLATNPFACAIQLAVSINKTPYARFDLNDYTVPHTHVGRSLTVLATAKEVRIVDGAEVLARHPRCYDKGQQIEDLTHIQALVEHKRQARRHSATDRLAQAAPASKDLITRAAQSGHSLQSIIAGLNRLLHRYGASELQAAILDVLSLEGPTPHPHAVHLALEHRREQRCQPPPLSINLPKHVQDKDRPVRAARLDVYDQLKEPSDDQS